MPSAEREIPTIHVSRLDTNKHQFMCDHQGAKALQFMCNAQGVQIAQFMRKQQGAWREQFMIFNRWCTETIHAQVIGRVRSTIHAWHTHGCLLQFMLLIKPVCSV